MPVLFSKHIKASTLRYGSVFEVGEPAKHPPPSTIPAPIVGLLAKNGLEPPPPGGKIDVGFLDTFLKARKTSLNQRLELKAALSQCNLI